MLCAVCNERPCYRSWDTCELCTGVAIQEYTKRKRALSNARVFDLMIGSLDRLLSEFLVKARSRELDEADAHTLKHHADDLIGVGKTAHEILERRGYK